MRNNPYIKHRNVTTDAFEQSKFVDNNMSLLCPESPDKGVKFGELKSSSHVVDMSKVKVRAVCKYLFKCGAGRFFCGSGSSCEHPPPPILGYWFKGKI
jgi:hypothetical protein